MDVDIIGKIILEEINILIFYSFRRSIYLLVSLVAIALVIVPVTPPLQPQGIVHAQTNSDNWSELLSQAEQLKNEDRYQEAEATYRQLLSQPQPASMNNNVYGGIQIDLAEIMETQGKFTEAIEFLQGLIDRTSRNDRLLTFARITLFRVLAHQKDAVQGVTNGLQAIRNNSYSPRGYRDLARGLAAQWQLADGFTFLETNLGYPLGLVSALELARAANSEYAEGERTFMGYRSSKSIRQDAIALYRQLVNRYPDQRTVREEFLVLLDQWGQPEEAISVYREAIRLNPEDYETYLKLARSFERNNQHNEAITVYEQLFTQGLNDRTLYVKLGESLEASQQLDIALQAYLRGIQAFPFPGPKDPRCHSFNSSRQTVYDRLVQLLAQQNRLDQVLNILETALPSSSAEVYSNLALSLAYRGYKEQAEAVNKRLRERYGDEESWQGRVETWSAGCANHDG